MYSAGKHAMKKKIGLFYGSTTCYTEMAGEKIRDAIDLILGSGAVTMHNVAFDSLHLMANYDYLILGIPTWDYGELQEDWELNWPQLDELQLSSKKIALYGLGDQVGYPEWFQDALGYLWQKVVQQGAETVGAWPNQGYDFDRSKALNTAGTHFVGLALDDENQLDISDSFILLWCRQVVDEFGL
tara:strand:- start:17048 stop:17602 length:555 start_codon:yes stop_codon:yes gene_type:complete